MGPPTRAARAPKAKAAALPVALHRQRSEVEALVPEWEALFSSAPLANPFLQPGWLLPWAHRHLAEDRVVVASVRSGPDLVAVAPFGLHHQAGTRVLSADGLRRGGRAHGAAGHPVGRGHAPARPGGHLRRAGGGVA